MTQKFTLKKYERLKSQKQIEKLFTSAKSKFKYPLKLLYISESSSDNNERLKFSVSVPKKKVKSAVTRNQIKRLIRESYRLNKKIISASSLTQLSLMFIYIEKELVDYSVIEKSIIHLLKQLENEVAD